jgi:HEAT repeat protein
MQQVQQLFGQAFQQRKLLERQKEQEMYERNQQEIENARKQKELEFNEQTSKLQAQRAKIDQNNADWLKLRMKAAIEALGVLRIPDDVSILLPQLDHPSRDIRASAAHALRDLGNTQAIPTLRARYQQEQVQQVRIAISDALRVLGQPIQ